MGTHFPSATHPSASFSATRRLTRTRAQVCHNRTPPTETAATAATTTRAPTMMRMIPTVLDMSYSLAYLEIIF